MLTANELSRSLNHPPPVGQEVGTQVPRRRARHFERQAYSSCIIAFLQGSSLNGVVSPDYRLIIAKGNPYYGRKLDVGVLPSHDPDTSSFALDGSFSITE